MLVGIQLKRCVEEVAMTYSTEERFKDSKVGFGFGERLR